MDYTTLPLLVDLSNAQANTDLNLLSAYVDGVIVKMGEGNPNGLPIYDPSFASHIQNAYVAHPKRLPAGAYYVLNTNQYSGMTLPSLQTMKRTDNPNYVFIQKTLQNKAVNFLGIVMQFPMAKDNSSNQWLMQDLDTLYRNLQEGMKTNPPEITPMPIVICTNEKYVDTYLNPTNFYTWIQNHEVNTLDVTKNAVQVWVQDYSQIINVQDTSMVNIKKHLAAAAKPNSVLNGIPSWFLWQIGSVGNIGLNVCFVSLDRLYAWMKYTPVVAPPVDIPCETGFHKDANGVCVADPVVCGANQHFDTTLNKCVDDVTEPPVTGDFSEVVNKLNEILVLLKQVFNR